jgi:hypothetical protein
VRRPCHKRRGRRKSTATAYLSAYPGAPAGRASLSRRPTGRRETPTGKPGGRIERLRSRPGPTPRRRLHHQGRTWAQIGQFVGQRKLSVTSDTYTHVLSDGREVDLASLLAAVRVGKADRSQIDFS